MNSKIIEVTHILEVYNLLDKIDFLKQYVKSINDTNYSYDRVIRLTK